MSTCVINLFDSSFGNTYHTAIETKNIEVDDDYLAPNETTIEIVKTDAPKIGDFITLSAYKNFLGVVTRVNQQDYTTELGFKPWLCIFDHDIRFNSKWQKSSKSLEESIRDIVKEYWIDANDSHQTLPIGTIELPTSATTKWTLGIEPSNENISYTIVNFYSDILEKAISKYRVAINYMYDLSSKKINLTIGQRRGSPNTIDLDRPEIEVTAFDVCDEMAGTNKLEIWNDENFTSKITYYLHTDKTWSTSNTKRIGAFVKLAVTSVSPEYDGSGDDRKVVKTFAQVAAEKAEEVLGEPTYRSSIEFKYIPGDALVYPDSMHYGSVVHLLKDGNEYNSIFTGRRYELDGRVSLVFGFVRTQYTKRIKLERNGV